MQALRAEDPRGEGLSPVFSPRGVVRNVGDCLDHAARSYVFAPGMSLTMPLDLRGGGPRDLYVAT